MKIKFIKDFKYPEVDISAGAVRNSEGYHLKDEVEEWFQWLIDNGFAEEVKESGWWKPKLDDIYYVVYPDGLIASCTWDGCPVDENRFFNGAIFKTEEAAERWRDYLKANATVRQDEGVMTPKEVESAERSNGDVWCISYTLDRGLFVYTCRLDVVPTRVGTIYFDTSEHAQASLDNHPDEWKIIANYDWSRE